MIDTILKAGNHTINQFDPFRSFMIDNLMGKILLAVMKLIFELV